MYKRETKAIVCDACRSTLIHPALPEDYCDAPYFKPTGETFCNVACVSSFFEEREQGWRDFFDGGQPRKRGVTIDEDGDIPGESSE